MKKKLVKISAVVLLVFLLALSAAVFTACDNGSPNNSEKVVTVYIGERKIELVTAREFLFDALNDMVADGTIAKFTYTGSVTGVSKDAFITEIDTLSPSYGTTEYIALFHTIDDVTLKDMGGWVPDEHRDGKTFYYSSVGAMLLPAIDGASYLFIIKSFSTDTLSA